MVAITSSLHTAVPNRRRRVRHKIQTPAYACFASESSTDLHEIVDISEDGIAIQCHSPLGVDRRIDLRLDLADCSQQILTTGHVVWINASGRAGLRFSSLPSDSLTRLREWLFVNVMSGVANSEVELLAGSQPPRPSYTDTLAAVSVVQRQVEARGSDIAGALQLIAERALTLVRASGAAIALAEGESDFMICRASAGSDAPPVGARLQVGSGFSGECVKSGNLLLCDDAELDPRVDRESCRALGIRSIVAAPVRTGNRSIGLIEVFSPEPSRFSEAEQRVLLKFADTVLSAAGRATRSENLPIVEDEAETFVPPQGSVLFASTDAEPEEKAPEQREPSQSLSLPRSYLLLLTLAAGAISMALGFLTAPFVQATAAPWILNKVRPRGREQMQTVLASTKAPARNSAVETASFEQLIQMANNGDGFAQNALGLRYAQGDGVKLDEREAVRWFIKAAEQGNVAAQSKLGAFYYSGRGVPSDANRAYFWMVVASLNGDEASNRQIPLVRTRLTRAQVASIEQNAGQWLQQHIAARPSASQEKANL